MFSAYSTWPLCGYRGIVCDNVIFLYRQYIEINTVAVQFEMPVSNGQISCFSSKLSIVDVDGMGMIQIKQAKLLFNF